jgi:hypothetical protein
VYIHVGGDINYSPIQTFGPQNCFIYGDCFQAWSPLTSSGTGGMVSGVGPGQGFSFKNDPVTTFLKYGYTEYLEISFTDKVYVSELLIGENRGMGAIKNILAKSPMGGWMSLYTTRVTADVQALYSKFSQYRQFRPDICGTPFLTSDLRFEIDTRTVPDWNEIDFFRLGGTQRYDGSAVNFNGNGVWKVIYVPDANASGIDSFSYSATDCPGTANNWSPNDGILQINIIPSAFAGSVLVPRDGRRIINLSQWSINSEDAKNPLEFTIETLPTSGHHIYIIYI